MNVFHGGAGMTHYRSKLKTVPNQPSVLELEFETLARILDLPPYIKEYKFMNSRKFSSDFAWPELLILVEIEGGTFMGGRHTRPIGYAKDCEKYNYAAMLGWTVLRFTAPMLRDGRADRQLCMAFSKTAMPK